jgi:hypothetical protein
VLTTVSLAKPTPKKKRIKPKSAKAKGATLQKLVRDTILKHFEGVLEPDDVKSTSMGANGEDVQLSPAARKLMPISIECKARAVWGPYSGYKQAEKNAEGKYQPVLVIKQNRDKPLAVIDLDHYIMLLKFRSENG